MGGDTARWRWPEVRVVAVGALLALVAAAVVTVGAQVYADLEGAPFADLSRDAAAVLEGPNYTGAYAMFTVLVWASSAAVALFCALVMRRSGDRAAFRYLLFGGLITAFMVLDDAFLLHETIGLILGEREEIFFVAYGLATVAFAWLHRRRLGPGLLLLAAAFGCWLSSAALDIVLSTGAPFIVEDGLKLAGVALWAYLMVRISMIEVRRLIRAQEPAAAAEAAAEVASAEPVTARHAQAHPGTPPPPGAHPPVGTRPPPGTPPPPGSRPPPGPLPPPGPRPPRMPQHLPPQPVGPRTQHTPRPPGLQPSGAHPHGALPPRPQPPAARPPSAPGPGPGRHPAPASAGQPVDDATRPVPAHRPAPRQAAPQQAAPPQSTPQQPTPQPAVPDDATRPVGVVPPRRSRDDEARTADPRREHDPSRQ